MHPTKPSRLKIAKASYGCSHLRMHAWASLEAQASGPGLKPWSGAHPG